MKRFTLFFVAYSFEHFSHAAKMLFVHENINAADRKQFLNFFKYIFSSPTHVPDSPFK